MLWFTLAACASSPATETPEKVEHEVEHEHEIPELSPISLGGGEKLKVVATTSIVADVVSNVGGDRIALTQLIPLGSDPHTFDPTPQDIAAVSQAHVVFANGAGLEEFLEPLLESADARNKTVEVSHGIALLEFGDEHEGEHEHTGGDPHTWTDPGNVAVWVHNIEQALSALDPANAGFYSTNAEAYQVKLVELDSWMRQQVAQIPEAECKIVTDHQLFGYLAHTYGFTQVGAIVPGYSTVAQPTAKELAELEDAIRELGVKAIFVGDTVNPNLAQRVAEDTGAQLVTLYTGSLTAKDGQADTYLDYMRYNVNAIVQALK
jgi:ABC-type Zn uptake system ZnuABC Zn-binding protein ZnuA